MRWGSRFAVIATLALSIARPVASQVVTGVAVLPDSSTPLSGAIVIATDARGVTAGRTLTGRRGEFTITFAAPGTFDLRLLRIGYRPTVTPRVTVGARDTARVRIVANAEAINLAAVNVRERETCRVSADTGLAVARVWEEARKAMLTTQLNSGAAQLFAEWIVYDRAMDSAQRVVRTQTVRTSRNPTTHAFKSLPASVLDTAGYVVIEDDATSYFAPDADVLLSDRFVASHCFHLVPAPGNMPGLIGVAFQPARDRRDMRDIEGTLWLDRTSAELKWLEFTYTNMPDAAEPAHPGGRVEFLRLADGMWLINRWIVRMPRLGQIDQTGNGMRRTVMSRNTVTLRSVLFAGGEVTQVFRGDSLLYRWVGPELAVQVVSTDPLIRSPGAILTLDGTDYTGVADSAGYIRMAPVLAGRYRAHVHTPFMDTLSVEPITAEVETRLAGATHVDSLKLPTSQNMLAGACPRDSIAHSEGMLHGRVTDEQLRPMDHAAVTITWQHNFNTTGDQLGFTEQTLGSLTDAKGYWRVCGVPRNTALSVRVVSDSGADVRRARLEEGESLGSVDLVAHHSSSVAREAGTAVSLGMQRDRALVELAVFTIQGTPLAGATLDINGGGVKRTVVTGESGRALVPDIAVGSIVVRARRIGYQEGQVAATIEAGRNTVPIVLSAVAAPTLDTMRVVGGRSVSGMLRHDEFDNRRLKGAATVSFTRDDIVKRNPVSLWQMLSAVPSIRIVSTDSMVFAVSSRTMVTSILDQGPCYIAFGLNGQLLTHDSFHKAFDLRFLPAPDEVYGLEVFAGAASIPVQYTGVGEGKWCGMVMIWTR